MANFWDIAKGVVGGGIFSKSFRKGAKDFFLGTPEVRENVSTLRDEQEPLYQQLQNSAMNRGAGGAFGTAADYYRDLMSDDSADYDAFAAPAMRQYNQDIVPGLSEQFAGMGAGGLSSSGFRNAQVQGATDLSERLGQLRAQLRQHGAQGLQNIGSQGLQNYSQNMVTQQGTPGMLSTIAPAIGTAAGAYIGGPGGAAAGNAAGNWLGSWFGGGSKGSNVGSNSSPYGQGQGMQASPSTRQPLPRFMEGY